MNSFYIIIVVLFLLQVMTRIRPKYFLKSFVAMYIPEYLHIIITIVIISFILGLCVLVILTLKATLARIGTG